MKTILVLLLSLMALHAGEDTLYMDGKTGLMWQNNSDVGVVAKAWVDMNEKSAMRCMFRGDPDSCADTSGDTAVSYCQSLQIDGFKDWRLPTIRELNSLGRNEAVVPIQLKLKDSFWSVTSALYKGKPREAAYIIMYSDDLNKKGPKGYTLTRDKNNKMFVRCVRGENK